MKIFYIYGHNIKNFRKKDLDMMDIPIAIYIFIISLIGLILLSIFNKKLKSITVTISEYTRNYILNRNRYVDFS